MARLLALLLVAALLFQTSWAAAAGYCEHETASQGALHFGHHAHVHPSTDGKPAPAGTLAVDDDCAFCHAGHPAIVPAVLATIVAQAADAVGRAPSPLPESAPARAPDRPQWPRLA